ncbi:MAG TPA: topoisomerase DNA-binding C4 zinc finger domain-containing protein [Frateuria sp.]|nr:topoisomerase DNA-binding C4 zinc finger domain-containing protein [Frateuria sp.]
MVHSVQTTSANPTSQSRPPASPETAPPCPKCGKEMQLRANRRTNERFWGCMSYPGCRGTRQLTESAL